jgi:hypothetical protein
MLNFLGGGACISSVVIIYNSPFIGASLNSQGFCDF